MKQQSLILSGINIQWPITELILSGEKTVETRTYPLPDKYKNKTLFIVETPGRSGDFKARIVGTIVFKKSTKYESQTAFDSDFHRHRVGKSSPWYWKKAKPKWGWHIASVKTIPSPVPAPRRRGIIFTSKIKIQL